MRTLTLLLLGIGPVACQAPWAAQPDRRPTRRPNVIYVLADDLGYGELGCFGQARIRTPNIDHLARQGMSFTRHYSGSPVCAPSRCVLLTGLHTGHAIVRDNWENGGWGPDAPEGQFPLPDGTPTLARSLQRSGYATACVGKWGLGGPETSGHPNRQGFDRFYGYLCQRKAHNYYPTHLWSDGEKELLPGNDYFRAHQKLAEPLASEAAYYERYQRETYAPDRMLEEALRFVRANAERPFFLLYASPIPHVALQVPRADVEAYPAAWDDGPYLGQKGYLPHPSPRRAYAAMVTRLDEEVGRLLDLLDELGLADDTIVMFSSDNGPTFNGGSDSEFFASTAGLRGRKTTLYEGGVRVPFVVRWPGVVEPGSTSDHVSGFQDVYPTLLEILGAVPPVPVDGVSFLPTLVGENQEARRDPLYWEYRARAQQALLLPPWKAIKHLGGPRAGELELYDLEVDPFEGRDVASAHPELCARVEGLLVDLRTPSEVYPLPGLDDEVAVDSSAR